MLLGRLIEEMLVAESAEFETMTVLLPLEDSERVRDLANKLGVPAGRLLAELIPEALSMAESELRAALLIDADRLNGALAETPEPSFSFDLPPRVK